MPSCRGTGNQAIQALSKQTVVCQWIFIDSECVELSCSGRALLVYAYNSLSVVLLLFRNFL